MAHHLFPGIVLQPQNYAYLYSEKSSPAPLGGDSLSPVLSHPRLDREREEMAFLGCANKVMED